MDGEIPEDIKAAARKVVERGYDEGLIEAVEKALIAERERCAKIARQYSTKLWDEPMEIAAMIRLTTPCPT